ncbi:hypothetical protein HW132_28260 [Brasilonema sp. CT11]|nr:hypothetical protein [Brasilonema sp. CT11]
MKVIYTTFEYTSGNSIVFEINARYAGYTAKLYKFTKMPKRTSNAYLILDQKCLYDEDKRINIDTEDFTQWLHTNGSFRVETGENGYRARKEKYHNVNYWYGVKKVSGKLHKRFIGKSAELTYERFVEIANNIRQPFAKSTLVDSKSPKEETDLKQEMATIDYKISTIQEQLNELLQEKNQIAKPEANWLTCEQVRKIILDTAVEQLSNFRKVKGADSKERYEKRLLTFIESVLERLEPNNQ